LSLSELFGVEFSAPFGVPGIVGRRQKIVALRSQNAAANHSIVDTKGLSVQQVLDCEETGLLQLTAAISRRDAQAMRQRLWDEIERKCGFRCDAPRTWRPGPIHGLQASEHAGAFAAMASPTVCSALDSIFEPDRWTRPPRWGHPLVTFPTGQSAWNIPHRNWHIDTGAGDITAPFDTVIVFAFLELIFHFPFLLSDPSA
jgi:hypothetical protein